MAKEIEVALIGFTIWRASRDDSIKEKTMHMQLLGSTLWPVLYYRNSYFYSSFFDKSAILFTGISLPKNPFRYFWKWCSLPLCIPVIVYTWLSVYKFFETVYSNRPLIVWFWVEIFETSIWIHEQTKHSNSGMSHLPNKNGKAMEIF